jgi:hypothetical protein
MTYYNPFLKAQTNANINEKFKIASLFPRMVSDEDVVSLFNLATLKELKDVLLHFKNEKSPSPDVWTDEFFTIFFDIVGEDLLEVVEDSRVKGNIRGGLNSTFLALIRKKKNLCHLMIFDRFHCATYVILDDIKSDCK